MISLGLLNEGDTAKISKIDGGRGLLLRVNELGFNIGSHLKIIRNLNRGPVLVELMGCKIAVGRGVATKILCEKVNEPKT